MDWPPLDNIDNIRLVVVLILIAVLLVSAFGVFGKRFQKASFIGWLVLASFALAIAAGLPAPPDIGVTLDGMEFARAYLYAIYYLGLFWGVGFMLHYFWQFYFNAKAPLWKKRDRNKLNEFYRTGCHGPHPGEPSNFHERTPDKREALLLGAFIGLAFAFLFSGGWQGTGRIPCTETIVQTTACR